MEKWQRKVQQRMLQLKNYTQENKKKSLIFLSCILLIVVLFSLSVSKIHQTIQSEQIDSLIMSEYTNEKVVALSNSQIKQKIASGSKFTVLFLDPEDPLNSLITGALNGKKIKNEYKETLFLVPLVYQKEQVKQRYSLGENQPTLIYYENGHEASRTVIKKRKNFQTSVLNDLESLSMTNIKKIQSTTTSSSNN